MKNYHFPAQPASDECPEVPVSVSVHANTLHEATVTLAAALKTDPKLEKEHPEFDGGVVKEKEKGGAVESKSVQRRKASLDS